MTWRVPPFDHAFAELAAFAEATWQPLGLLVSGSIVRGEAGPTSDLDVFVVHDQPWRVRVQRRFAGVPAELFVNPPAQIRQYFANQHADGVPSTAHMFATGELVGLAGAPPPRTSGSPASRRGPRASLPAVAPGAPLPASLTSAPPASLR